MKFEADLRATGYVKKRDDTGSWGREERDRGIKFRTVVYQRSLKGGDETVEITHRTRSAGAFHVVYNKNEHIIIDIKPGQPDSYVQEFQEILGTSSAMQ